MIYRVRKPLNIFPTNRSRVRLWDKRHTRYMTHGAHSLMSNRFFYTALYRFADNWS